MDASLKIRLPADLKAKAETLAAKTCVSLSDIARMAINEKVARAEEETPTQTGGAGQQAANAQ